MSLQSQCAIPMEKNFGVEYSVKSTKVEAISIDVFARTDRTLAQRKRSAFAKIGFFENLSGCREMSLSAAKWHFRPGSGSRGGTVRFRVVSPLYTMSIISSDRARDSFEQVPFRPLFVF